MGSATGEEMDGSIASVNHYGTGFVPLTKHKAVLRKMLLPSIPLEHMPSARKWFLDRL
jgi:hypothetical protein